MSISTVSRAMDSLPYDSLKSLCGNAQKFSTVPTEMQVRLLELLPKDQQGCPLSTRSPNAFDEAIRTLAYQAIEEEPANGSAVRSIDDPSGHFSNTT